MPISFSTLGVAATVFLGVSAASSNSAKADALSIECLPDKYATATSGTETEVGYTGVTVATSSGGTGSVTILPDPTESCILKGTPVSRKSCKYTATDSKGDSASCTIIMKILKDPCPSGSNVCDDPHMLGLHGQTINWSGEDGGWYSLVKDDEVGLQVNVRVTAPLPKEFPDRQLITGISVLSEGHSLVVKVKNPYTVSTTGCPEGVSPCLSNGGLRFIVDGVEAETLANPTRDEHVTDSIVVSASNLPVECRQFGGAKIWARMYEEMLDGKRELADGTFEDWVLSFETMAAPEWCARFIALYGLADEQSLYSVFKIKTPGADIRLHAGIGYQGGGDLDWDGRVLPDVDFWQMDVGIDGLSLDNVNMSGLLGGTVRPVLDTDGREIMEGQDAFRGTVEDYRVSGALGTDFALLHGDN